MRTPWLLSLAHHRLWGRRLPAKNATVHPFPFEPPSASSLFSSPFHLRLASYISLRGVAVGLLFCSHFTGCPGSPFGTELPVHLQGPFLLKSAAVLPPPPLFRLLHISTSTSAIDLHIPTVYSVTPLIFVLSTLVPARSLFLPFRWYQPYITSPCQHKAWPCS